MSTSVLLVINSNTCEPCRKLIDDQSNINNAIKELYPNIRTIWCCLDKTDLTILPKPFDTSLIHVPIVLYFADDSWKKYISGEGIAKGVYIFDNEILVQYGSAYTSDTILKWLKDVTEVETAVKRLETVQINNIGEENTSPEYDGEHCIQYYDCCGEPITCPECGSHNIEIIDEHPGKTHGVSPREDEYVLLPLVDDSNVRSCIYDGCVLPKVLPKCEDDELTCSPLHLNSTQIVKGVVRDCDKDYISLEIMLEGNLITLGFDSKSNTLKFGLENRFGKTKTSMIL